MDEAGQALSAVMAFVIGNSISEAAWLTMITRSGQSEQEWVERLRPAVEQAAQAHPRQRERLATTKDPRQTRDDNFAYGLDRILDGLQTRLGTV